MKKHNKHGEEETHNQSPSSENNPTDIPIPGERKASLVRYLAVLFAIAFMLILLTYFIQVRDSHDTISELSQTNASALQNAEKLQNENRAMREENIRLAEELESKESQWNDDMEDLLTKMDGITEENTIATEASIAIQHTYELLMEAITAAQSQNTPLLLTILAEIELSKEDLSEGALAIYNQIVLNLETTIEEE